MRHVMTLFGMAALLGAGVAGAAAEGSGPTPELRARYDATLTDPQLRARSADLGRLRIEFCVQCHGEDGNSAKSYVPKLAGQNPLYLLDQLQRFDDGRRKHYVMGTLAKGLSPDDMVNVANYFATQVLRSAGGDPSLASSGKALYDAKCTGCHGLDGRGKEGYARIAGQQPQYVALTLRGFRDGAEHRTSAAMSGVTRGLTDANIDALAAYVAGLN